MPEPPTKDAKDPGGRLNAAPGRIFAGYHGALSMVGLTPGRPVEATP